MTTDSRRRVAMEFRYSLSVILLASLKRYFRRAADLIDYLDENHEELKNEVRMKDAMEDEAREEIKARKEKEELCNKLETSCSLREETELLYRSSCCLLCVKTSRNIVTLPCGHFCLCAECAKHSNACPVSDCKMLITDTIHVFLV